MAAVGFTALFFPKLGSTSTSQGSQSERAELGRAIRDEGTKFAFRRRRVGHPTNGDIQGLPTVAVFSKALPHDSIGEVSQGNIRTLLRAIRTGSFSLLNRINFGILRLANPEAAHAYSMQGADSHQHRIPRAPAFSSARVAGEMAEVYWQALARDINFTDYSTSTIISDATTDLNSTFSDLDIPTAGGQITSDTIFKGKLIGDDVGPYLSQFLLQDRQVGSITVSQRQRTVFPGYDHNSSETDWLNLQNGQKSFASEVFDPVPRYIRNGRDLAEYVQKDASYQAYYFAIAPFLTLEPPPFGSGSYLFRQGHSDVFVNFGAAHIVNMLGEVANLAFKAAWYQKWSVHMRLRPEEFAGKIHQHLAGNANYPINQEILNSPVLGRVIQQFGTALMPLAYRDGCPTHPSYPAGHAVVAGACVTLLKAVMDENFPILNPVIPDSTGLNLLPYTGPDANQLTLGSELNKLASNIAIGRNWAGIHYRTDATAGLELGEEVTLRFLRETTDLYLENYSFSFTRFNGNTVTVRA